MKDIYVVVEPANEVDETEELAQVISDYGFHMRLEDAQKEVRGFDNPLECRIFKLSATQVDYAPQDILADIEIDKQDEADRLRKS